MSPVSPFEAPTKMRRCTVHFGRLDSGFGRWILGATERRGGGPGDEKFSFPKISVLIKLLVSGPSQNHH